MPLIKHPLSTHKENLRSVQMKEPSVIDDLLHNLPPLPSSELTDPHDDVTLPRLIEALQHRHRIRQMMIDEYSQAANVMNSMLQELDNNLISKDNLIHEQNGKLVEKDKIIQSNTSEIECLKKGTKMQEYKIDILQKMTKIYEDDKRSLEQELETKEQRLQREVSNKRRLEKHMHSVVRDTKLKCEKECDRRVNVIKLEMQNRLWVKEEKLKQLKAIVTEDRIPDRPDRPPCQMQPKQHLPAPRLPSPTPAPLPSPSPSTSSSSSPLPCPVDSPHVTPVPVSPTRPEEVEMNPRPDCPIPCTSSPLSVTGCISAWEQRSAEDSRQGHYSPCTPTRTQSPAGSSASQARRRAMCLTRKEEKSNSPQLNLNLIERSYRTITPVRPLHRHTRSTAGEKWVDHTPLTSIDLGTVLQPIIPRAIKVSEPSEKALSKCDRYVLTHQEVASDGEIQTKLIKGEVIKTRGGGQAVQFTDIETLKQEFTTVQSLKRKSSEGKPANGDRAEKDCTDVETRCSVAVEMRTGSNMGPGYEHQRINKRRKR
ncbi:kinesin-like protein KIF23 [Sparus aurata]|uniref:Kinesin-like protein KIF23 n=1 Tax=Sparus aurata TaxID=8175 RepID=A0A671VMZ8_SPAAU|nr:kinesin-like protein KIF23 [Sparus aurata]